MAYATQAKVAAIAERVASVMVCVRSVQDDEAASSIPKGLISTTNKDDVTPHLHSDGVLGCNAHEILL